MEKYQDYIQVGVSIAIVLLYFILRRVNKKIVKRYGLKNNIDEGRTTYTINILNLLFLGLAFVVLGLVWEVSFKGLSIYLASIFTVVGVAFFAAWSILSNITASVILYFYYPYRIGSYVKIIDGDNSIIGKVKNISLFAIKIEIDDENVVSYPNNLAIQKPMIHYDKKPSETKEEKSDS